MTSPRPTTLADAQALASSFLEARRAKHADFRMDATTGGDGGTDGGTNGQPDPAADQKPDDSKDEPKSVEERLAELETQLEETKRNSRKWEQRAKDNKAAADQWAQAQAANATPDQKLALAEERAAKAERELARYKVASETGVPAALIHGDNEDEMREAAKAAIEFKGQQPKPTPKPDPTQGGKGEDKRPRGAEEGRAEAARRFSKKS